MSGLVIVSWVFLRVVTVVKHHLFPSGDQRACSLACHPHHCCHSNDALGLGAGLGHNVRNLGCALLPLTLADMLSPIFFLENFAFSFHFLSFFLSFLTLLILSS
jgi:hypothetical protein